MVHCVQSHALYIMETKARSRDGKHFFLSTLQSDSNKPPTIDPPLNVPILLGCSILQHVMLFVDKAEIAGVFTAQKNSEMIQQILIKMGYPQLPMPIQTDNTTAQDIITNTVKQCKTRAMDMCFIVFETKPFK